MGLSATQLGSWRSWHSEDAPLRLAVSACLLGAEVRYDGAHARDGFVADTLGRWFELVPVCPEFDIGMGVPRPSIRLVDEGGGTRLVAPATGGDFTGRMRVYAEEKVRELGAKGLDGYVLKKSSPSCGPGRVRVYRNGGVLRRDGSGLFAATLIARWPGLPVEDEGRLTDPELSENFIERVFGRNRWRTLARRGLTRRRLIEFHTAHRFLLLAHNQAAYRRLGALTAALGAMPDREVYARYAIDFQAALRTKATPRKHTTVLQHAFGHLRRALSAQEKRDMLAAIEDYGAGRLPLVVPLTLLRFSIRRYGVDYLAGQLYFDPHPRELMLRNHV